MQTFLQILQYLDGDQFCHCDRSNRKCRSGMGFEAYGRDQFGPEIGHIEFSVGLDLTQLVLANLTYHTLYLHIY